ncbi:MAG: hypothetical protein IPL41_10950 [Micropruina sp.]|nr:hypothetical protein [Micropruina sp.]
MMQAFLDRYADADGAAGADVFLWVIALTLGYTATLYPALAITRLRAEEERGLGELLLSTPASRTAWATSHALIAAAGTVLILGAGGLTTGIAVAAGTAAITPAPALAATLLQAPAALVLGGLTLLAFGLLPRATAGIAWIGFLSIQLFELVGPIVGIDFQLVEWIIPYFHLPKILTGGTFTATPVIILIALTTALGASGVLALRRRDLQPLN